MLQRRFAKGRNCSPDWKFARSCQVSEKGVCDYFALLNCSQMFSFFQIRTELVKKLTDIDLKDTTQAQQTIGALIEVTKDKTELTAQTQVSQCFILASQVSISAR